ncbi:MAG: RsmD family RNA methyltransferase [Candidatus Dormibacteraeota bacterium]|nr:RsmD family RNA methyltransferase [Candidatus Dormibacteraeota bacterium]
MHHRNPAPPDPGLATGGGPRRLTRRGLRPARGARLTGGEAAGRWLLTVEEPDLRATSGVARGALFNILGDQVYGMRVVDLCAGVGTLGIEALSRGAAHATFVEVRSARAQLIARNCGSLGFSDRAQVVTEDAEGWVRRSGDIMARSQLVLADPPYAAPGPELLSRLLVQVGRLAAEVPGWDPTVVLEHHRELVLDDAPGALNCVRVARYGSTVLSFYRRSP